MKNVKEIYYATRENNIHLRGSWIPRELNTVADQVSKFVEYDDWETTEKFFRHHSLRGYV